MLKFSTKAKAHTYHDCFLNTIECETKHNDKVNKVYNSLPSISSNLKQQEKSLDHNRGVARALASARDRTA